MSQYFPKLYDLFRGDINDKVDLSNYEIKTDLKNVTGIDTSKLAPKSGLVSLKAEISKLDINKLVSVPVDLSKLSDWVKNDFFKKKLKLNKKLVAKVNDIDISGFVLKTKYDTDKSDLEKKICNADKKLPHTNGLVKKQVIMLRLLK